MIVKAILVFVLLMFAVSARPQLKIAGSNALVYSFVRTSQFTSNGANGISVEAIKSGRFGFQGGVVANIALSSGFFQPGILVTSTSSKIRFFDAKNELIVDDVFNRVDIPLLFGFKFGPYKISSHEIGPFNILVGPLGSYFISRPNSSLYFLNQGIIRNFKDGAFTFQYGINFIVYRNVVVEFKYIRNLMLEDGIQIGGQHYKFESANNQFFLGANLFFAKKRSVRRDNK